jgi:UDP-N-acetylglucosamine 3-dehydrogenase
MYKVGIVGCGGRGKAHARGYQASEDVQIVACVDPISEARWDFQTEFDVERTYKDIRDMLEYEQLDIVSICTWPEFHADMVLACSGKGVKAIHCEKPMAPTWGESKSIYQMCVDHKVLITFCHQRRFGATFRTAKRLLQEGAIGQLIRLEGSCSNLYDWGTHWFDMFFFYNEDSPADWVMGQIDASEENSHFGVSVEAGGVSWIRWKNGVEGLLATGNTSLQHATNRLIGSDGIIEVGVSEEIPLRLLRHDAYGWEIPPLGDHEEEDLTVLSILDLIDALKSGRVPELDGHRALQATELIFATYESSRRRAKVSLPLTVDDSAFKTMLDSGDIGGAVKGT